MFPGAIFSELGAVIRNVKVGLFIFGGRLGGIHGYFTLGGDGIASSALPTGAIPWLLG